MEPKDLKMVILDFDGTSAEYSDTIRVHDKVSRALRELGDIGIPWMVATDRPYADLVEVTRHLNSQQKPAAMLTQQRYVYFLGQDNRYYEHSSWNREAMLLHRELWDEVSPHFSCWTETITRQVNPLKCIQDMESYSFIVSELDVQELDTVLRSLVSGFPNAQVSGNQ